MVRTLTQGSILVFLRKPIATRHFPDGVRTPSPSSGFTYVSEKRFQSPCRPLDPPMFQKNRSGLPLSPFGSAYISEKSPDSMSPLWIRLCLRKSPDSLSPPLDPPMFQKKKQFCSFGHKRLLFPSIFILFSFN